MDTEEAQEISKEIVEKVTERELRKQKYAQYQRTKQTADYKVPKIDPIPVPDLTKPKQKKEGWPPSASSNFDVPQYEEISGYGNKWQLGMQSASATPRLSDKKNQIEKAKLRIPLGNITAFQDYMPTMMSALDNPWKPLSKGTTTLSWTTVPSLVFLSMPGTPISRPDGQGKRLSESYQMYTTERTPEDNPGILVKLPNLEKKYGTSMVLMDKKSRHLYVAGIEGYKKIDEKGLLFPSESMIVAGALGEDKGEPVPFMPDSKIQGTPAAESTWVPLKASTGKREAVEQRNL